MTRRPSLLSLRTCIPFALLGFGATLFAGCVDPEGSFNDYVKRRGIGSDAGSDDSGACTPPAPGEVQGPVFLAVSLTDLGPKTPFTYAGTLETPEVNGNTGVLFKLQPLNVKDRKTPASSEIPVRGPFEITPSGDLTANFPSEVIPGAANPITGGNATSQVTLTGKICGKSDFYCGTVAAYASDPPLGDLRGTFTLTMVSDANAIPPDPLYYDCAKHVADPPPP